MARNKQEGPELKLYEIDTMQYLTKKNIAYGVTTLAEFCRNNGPEIAKQANLTVGKALERFKESFNVQDIVNGTNNGSAYDTWLRKNGFLNSQNDRYELSPLGSALRSSAIEERDFCFLLLSKQWIKITDVGTPDEYKRNLLAFLFEKIKDGSLTLESAFVEQVGQLSLDSFASQYEGLKLSNKEAARFLVDPLKIADIISVENGQVVLTEYARSIADDFLRNEDKLKSPSQVDGSEETFWNSTKYGVYDLISPENSDLYKKAYPRLFCLKCERSCVDMECKQKIFYGAPGTGKSFSVKKIVSHNENKIDSNLVASRFEEYLCEKLLKNVETDKETKVKESVLRLKACINSEYLGSCYSKIVNKNFSKLSECTDISAIEEISALMQSDKEGEIFLFKKGTFGNALTALNNYRDFLKDPNTSFPFQKKSPQVFRTTFHPDYDYAQFVGSYKPKKEGTSITYSFVPQVFANAVKAALENPSQPIYLVIEEINRGNCAQIFGDIFQLLDRDENGVSRYSINLDSDFAEWLGHDTLRLPKNFNILATMNTSDQSLFPMDSAFKRRFDWEYVPIKYTKDADCGDCWDADKFVIKLDDETCYSWLDFLEKVNDDIYDVSQSEDKQMGEFFVKPKDHEVDQDMFLSKVMFYLWDSVYKDEVDRKNVFHFDWTFANGKKSAVTFQNLFKNKADTIEILKKVMENLKVEAI